MNELSTRSAVVIDTGGLFLPVARRLARDFGLVYYASEWVEAFPGVNRSMVGTGFKDIVHVEDALSVVGEVELAVFPDCSHPGLQAHLEELGVAVWGSGQGVELELDRQRWLALLEELGLDVPPHRKVHGVEALEEALMGIEDAYIKVSRWRGAMETQHWRGWELDRWWLDALRAHLGPVGERMEFVVCEGIEDAVELGVDSYCMRGQWPDTMLHGIEAKDKAYMGRVTVRAGMPDEVQELLMALSGTLSEASYRNWVSVEMRVTKDKAYAIDFTARAGLPSSASQMELWGNYSDIVWAGAHGELVEPEPVAEYSAELAVSMKSEVGGWATVEVPAELEQWLKLGRCCLVNGVVAVPPAPWGHEELVGWLVAVGSSPTETVDLLLERAAQLPDGMRVDVAALGHVIKAVDEEREKGVEFTSKAMPEPGIVIEEGP